MLTLKDKVWCLLDDADNLPFGKQDVKTKVDSKGKYIRTPYKLCEEIVQQICPKLNDLNNAKVLVVDTINFIPVLLAFGINKCNITYIAPYVFKGEIASKIGVHVVQDSLLTWKTDMKFDVIIGNPPYQLPRVGTTATEDLYSKFVNKSISLKPEYIAMVIPSDWIGPNSSVIKKTLFNSGNLAKICLYGQKWFNVAKDTCCIFYTKSKNAMTEITDINDTTINISLSNITAISLDNKLTIFLTKFTGYNRYLSERWLHGNLNLNKLDKFSGNDIEFIQAVGKKGEILSTSYIRHGIELTGYGISKLVLPTVGSNDKIGQIKLAKKHQVGGHSVVFIVAEDDTIATNIKSYLESKIIRLLIKSLKKSTPNSKGLFSCIPDINFDKTWTDKELYSYFKLNQEEINYIEQIIK